MADKPRITKIKVPTQKPKKNRRRITKPDLLTGWRLGKQSLGTLWRHAKQLLPIGIIYCIVSALTTGGATQAAYLSLKSAINEFVGRGITGVGSLFALTTSGVISQPQTEAKRVLSIALILFTWLIIMWTLRNIVINPKAKIRDAFYNGPAAIIPLLGVAGLLVMQFLPAAFGVFALQTAVSIGPVGWVEGSVLIALSTLLIVTSIYWACNSIVALYVVTKPGTYPLQALRTARMLVSGKRLLVSLYVIWLGLWLLLASALVLLPVLILDNTFALHSVPLVPLALQVLGGFYVLFCAVYLHNLHQELRHEQA